MMIRWMIMDQSFLFETCTSRAADEWISNSATTGWLVGWLIGWLQNHLISNVGYHRICVCNCFMFVY